MRSAIRSNLTRRLPPSNITNKTKVYCKHENKFKSVAKSGEWPLFGRFWLKIPGICMVVSNFFSNFILHNLFSKDFNISRCKPLAAQMRGKPVWQKISEERLLLLKDERHFWPFQSRAENNFNISTHRRKLLPPKTTFSKTYTSILDFSKQLTVNVRS